MSQLNARGGAFGMEEIDDAGERRDLLVVPQAEVAVGDAAFGRHARGLEDDEAEAADARSGPDARSASHWRGRADGGILAHRGDDGAVAERQVAQGERREKQGHEGWGRRRRGAAI